MKPVLIAFLLSAQAPTAPSELEQLTTLRAGDEACALFNQVERALLEAAIARTRDDAVRAGAAPESLDALEEQRSPLPCTDDRLTRLGADHRARIGELVGFTEIRFEGVNRVWVVDRRPPRRGAGPSWRVSQSTSEATAIFGVARLDGEPAFALAFNAEAPFASAVLVMRDAARQPYPIDFTANGLLAPPGGDPASAWGAPPSQESRWLAADRLNAETAAALAPASGDPARGFVFTQEALTTMAQLTPREGVSIELRDRAGDIAARYWFEVGALRAALAMQAAPLVQETASETPGVGQ